MTARRTRTPKIEPKTMPTVAEGVPAEFPRGNREDAAFMDGVTVA